MTNGEYHKKQHRGSSPARHGETIFTQAAGLHLSPEEWKNLTWYPVSAGAHKTKQSRTDPRNTPSSQE